MKTVILAGGYGTRLYPLTLDRPKALISISEEKTILDFMWEKITKISTEVFLISNDKFFHIFDEWRRRRNAKIKILNDGTRNNEERLGAIGDLELLLNIEELNEDLLVVGSDNIFDWELKDFVEFSREKQKVTIGLYDVEFLEKAVRFGVVEVDGDGKVLRMEEKPINPFSTLIGVCIYYFPLSKLFFISEYSRMVREHLKDAPGFFFSWLYEREEIYGYICRGKWFDIGTLQSLEEARAYFKDR